MENNKENKSEAVTDEVSQNDLAIGAKIVNKLFLRQSPQKIAQDLGVPLERVLAIQSHYLS